MKSFKKDTKNKDKEKEFVSTLIYWGWIVKENEEDSIQKNVLLTGSWDSI